MATTSIEKEDAIHPGKPVVVSSLLPEPPVKKSRPLRG